MVILSTLEAGLLRCTTAYKGHKTAVRCLALGRPHEAEAAVIFSAAGKGELKAWQVLRQPQSGLQLSLRSQWPHRKSDRSDVTYRTMALLAAEAPEGRHLIVAGCSDAYLRVFLYDPATARFRLHGSSSAHGRCILDVGRVQDVAGGALSHVFLSSATDGRIFVWDLTRCTEHDGGPGSDQRLGEPILAVRCHQSGINSVSSRLVHTMTSTEGTVTSRHLVCSGGDDNAVGACLLSISSDGDARCMWQCSVADGHASAVTAVALLPSAGPCLTGTHALASVGSDQRLIVWRVALRDTGHTDAATDVQGDRAASATGSTPDTGSITLATATVVAVTDPLDMTTYTDR